MTENRHEKADSYEKVLRRFAELGGDLLAANQGGETALSLLNNNALEMRADGLRVGFIKSGRSGNPF